MKQIMNGEALNSTLDTISDKILSMHPQTEDIVLVGIRSKGLELARRIANKIGKRAGMEIPVGVIDTSLYRDDVNVSANRPVLCKTQIPFQVTGKKIILVDDVLYTGRTIRAALDAIMDMGRPSCIQLAVVCDRGHRELPIHADFIGMQVKTTREESVRIIFKDNPAQDEVVLLQEPETIHW